MDIFTVKVAIGIIFFISLIFSVIGFYQYTFNIDGKTAAKAKTKILVGGFLLILSVFSLMLAISVEEPVSVQHMEIKVKEASVVKIKPYRSANYFVCELTDSEGTIFKSESRKYKVDAKNLCTSFEIGNTYSVDFREYNKDYILVENRE